VEVEVGWLFVDLVLVVFGIVAAIKSKKALGKRTMNVFGLTD
jgi:hypothetical protein